jgi:hypothetical protein
MSYYTSSVNTQDDLLLHNLMNFYENHDNMKTIQTIVNGESKISLRIIDWFVTNYAKKYDTQYVIRMRTGILKDLIEDCVFKVYHRYKLQLKAYSKRRFDSFCRWDRISIPCLSRDSMLCSGSPSNEECLMETTIGQLNFFKWAIDNRILDYIEQNYAEIEKDMNSRNSSSSRRNTTSSTESSDNSEETPPPPKTDGKTRKKRQELTVSASKCIKKEMIKIVVTFDR